MPIPSLMTRLPLAVTFLAVTSAPIWLWSTAQHSAAQRVTAMDTAPVRWTSIGPLGLPNGRVAAIAIDPADPDHWLLGAGNGGVWETRNAGTSFVPITDDWPSLAIGAIAFAPSDPLTIYVGTGESIDGIGRAGFGIMKSIDGARTWTLLAAQSFERASVKRLRVHPTTPEVVFAATVRGGFGRDANNGNPSPPPFGILKSTNGGVTWIQTLVGQATALEIDPRNVDRQFAAIGEQRIFGFLSNPIPPGTVPNGVYRTLDGGRTWGVVAGPWGPSTPTKAAAGRIELATAPSNPDVLYASMQIAPGNGPSNTNLLGLYRTDDAWSATPTWTQIPTEATGPGGYCAGKCGYTHVLSVDPTDPNTLMVGGEHESLWRCTNCGASPAWVKRGLVGYGDYHVLVWSGNRFVVGEDHGVFSTRDLGVTWQRLTNTLTIATFEGGALHPTNPDIVMGGLRDLGGVLVRGENRVWRFIGGVPFAEAEVAISSSHPDTDWMLAGNWGRVGRTTNGGQTWINADSGIDKTGAPFVAPVRKCPSDDNVFLTGTNRIWRTDNFFSSVAPTWVANGPAHPFLSPQILDAPGTIFAIAYAPSDSNCGTYAFGNRGGEIQLTQNGGRSWTSLDPAKTLPGRPVNGLAFDPTTPGVLYAAFSSFAIATPAKTGHVFKTENALAAAPVWVDVSPPIDVPFNVVALDPRDPQIVYAGSDTGLWRSTDGAATWQRMGPETGLPNASVHDVQINPVTNRTIVFTYGRGAYQLSP